MVRLALTLITAAMFLSAASGQEAAPLKLTRVLGLDGKPWPIKVSRKLAPEIETFDAPYVLTPGLPKPALWYLEGAECVPVTYAPAGKRLTNFEVLRSGRAIFLTYVADGLNEFWSLEAGKASQVTLDGRPLSQRARITRRGDFAYIYTGDFSGKTQIYQVIDGVATALKLDGADRGTISFAWEIAGKLLLAFYKDGTYDFHTLADGKFAPAWDRNGEQDYDRQVDSIIEIWDGARMFFDITYRDQSQGAWVFDGAKLEAVKQHWGKVYAAALDGVYFIGDKGLMLANGATVREVKTSAKPTTLTSHGGGLLAAGETATWLVRGTSVVELPAGAELVAWTGWADVLRVDAKLKLYTDGKPVEELELPEDFGQVERAIRRSTGAYLMERTTESEFRLWHLRR